MPDSKKVAILQSNYIPWKGYFDIINAVDEFIIFDDMQFTRRDWRNRNKIKTAQGLSWLTIAVQNDSYFQKINETLVSESNWATKHWRTIAQVYAKAPYFKEYKDVFEALYAEVATIPELSLINYRFIQNICGLLDIKTKLTWSSDYVLVDGKTERLVKLVQDAGGTEYLSGPAAKDYVEEHLFEAAGMKVLWMSYEGYPEYPQLHGGPFEHGVSILDLLFNVGPDAPQYMKTFANQVTR